MSISDRGSRPFRYLAAVTVISVLLIILNVVLGMRIPFTVSFLLGYVGALLVFIIWHAVLTKGWKHSLIMLSLSFLVAFTAEALGVNFGLVFGHYSYSKILGVSLFGVPLLAALAWEPIVYAAFCLCEMLALNSSNQRNNHLANSSIIWMAIIGALATTAWDMMIDPIAVSQGWWIWADGGPYMPYIVNGVPIQNFIGWLGVAFTINLLYRKISDRIPHINRSATLTYYGPLTLYLSLFLTSFGVAVTILQRPEVALVGVLAMGPFIAIAFTNLPVFLPDIHKFTSTAKQ